MALPVSILITWVIAVAVEALESVAEVCLAAVGAVAGVCVTVGSPHIAAAPHGADLPSPACEEDLRGIVFVN